MPKDTPLVSICIANYNGLEIIDECLRSVIEQQGRISIEILVHDDASTDGSVAHIQARYPDVLLIVSAENAGFCIANNRMVARARGQFVLLLNNDAALYPDALKTLLAEAKRLERPAILTLPQYDATSGALVDRGCLLDPFFNPVPNLDPKRTDVAMVIGACLWIPKQLWDELEGFPEWFGSIAEDMYLCCRARLAGYAVRAVHTSGYRHWQGKTFGGNKVVSNRLATTFRRRALSERNKIFVAIVASPSPQLILLMPLHLILIILEGLVLSVLMRSFKVWRSVYTQLIPALWVERTRLGRLRFDIQKSRRITLLKWLNVFVLTPRKLSMLLIYGLPEMR